MSNAATSIPVSASTPDINDAADRAAIDASCRLPVLSFFASAVFWLIVGTVFALLASIKLHNPLFAVEIPASLAHWLNQFYPLVPANTVETLNGALTFGRVRPAHLNTVAYGWASTAALSLIHI